MLNLNRKILTLLTMINIHIMHYKLLHKFLQTIKCCFQVQVQATSLLKRNKHWNAFRVWLYEKHLVHLCGYPTHQGSRKKSLWKKNSETLNLTLSLTWHRCGKNPPGKNPWELFSGGIFSWHCCWYQISFIFILYLYDHGKSRNENYANAYVPI